LPPQASCVTKVVQALQRGLAVLEVLNRHNGLNANQVARRASLSRGTAHRMLETLREAGYVLRDEHSGAYWLSIRVRGLSDGYIDELWIANIVRPRIEKLGKEIVWPVNITVPSGIEMVVRAATDYHSRLARYLIPTGWSRPMAGSASGRTFLAHCSPEDRKTFVELIANTSKNPRDEPAKNVAALNRKLDEISARGYDTQLSDENVMAMSIPIYEGRYAFACLTTRFSAQNISLEKAEERFLPALRATADEIGQLYAARVTSRPRQDGDEA
jgi:IclR family mhp operon transcriptional activator